MISGVGGLYSSTSPGTINLIASGWIDYDNITFDVPHLIFFRLVTSLKVGLMALLSSFLTPFLDPSVGDKNYGVWMNICLRSIFSWTQGWFMISNK